MNAQEYYESLLKEYEALRKARNQGDLSVSKHALDILKQRVNMAKGKAAAALVVKRQIRLF